LYIMTSTPSLSLCGGSRISKQRKLTWFVQNAGGDQRERARAKAQKKQADLTKGKVKDGDSAAKRKERFVLHLPIRD
jgi:hypothetical protein